MFCTKCGTKTSKNASYCEKCGSRLGVTREVSATKTTSFLSVFQGRLGRRNYFVGYLIAFAPTIIASLSWALFKIVGYFFGVEAGGGTSGGEISTIGQLVNTSISLVIMILGIVGFFALILIPLLIIPRRHHDLNQPGWYFMVCVLAILILTLIDASLGGIGSLVYFGYLMLAKGENGDNWYGSVDTGRGIKHIIGLN